ncbi:MAG: hypothetical protein KF744_10890 [Taibaiella sp.]|nr:hypothetical protein [Taibaiella sp.]
MRLILCLLLLLPAISRGQVYVLGVAQDGGYPHAGCTKGCCSQAWKDASKRRFVASLAVVAGDKWWLFEATPDIKEQLQYFRDITGGKFSYLPEGVFLTHAHIGHYAGLIQFGREVMSTKELPVYVLPKMKSFLEENGPWSQLVKLRNISLRQMQPGMAANEITGAGESFTVSAFSVPHRDEYSETAGFRIRLGSKTYLFIPDIDKWSKWETDIRKLVADVDVALLDGTFYRDGELQGRSMSEVPHPFVEETMSILADAELKKRVYFIHFNHTNPILWDTKSSLEVEKHGFHIAKQGENLTSYSTK